MVRSISTASKQGARSLARPSDLDSTKEAHSSLTPELVVALCGPIGSPLHETAEQIKSLLNEYGYSTVSLRLSEIITINADGVGHPINTSSRLDQIKSLIAAGDELRKKFGNDILAKLAIAKISADRRKRYGSFEDKASESSRDPAQATNAQRICHVIDSIKNDAELELLRLIYGDALYAIGVFSPIEVRLENLKHSGALDEIAIKELIDLDSGEEFSHGQSVRNTFPRCDYFLRIDKAPARNDPVAASQIFAKLMRLFNLIFHTSVVTPTAEETAMYASASAARNSACFSRQVGAAVASKSGEVLAVGWNDVPRPGGGLYGKPPLDPTSANTEDKRCFMLPGERCHNDQEKRSVINALVEDLVSGGHIEKKNAHDAKALMLKSRVGDLIEFSRAVHAEMHAILGACRVAGDRVVGGKIFVTTYPCHSCARHIVAAGISEVYFIEPYRKSLATKLHGDALSEASYATGKVKLLQFEGVAPRRFIDMFEARDRKKDGVLALQGKAVATPTNRVSVKAIPRLEEAVVAEVKSKRLQVLSLIEDVSDDDITPAPQAG